VQRFATGLITTDFLEYPRPPFIGKSCRILNRLDPHRKCNAFDGKSIIRGREIVIEAQNRTAAQKVVGLIHGAAVLLWNDPILANQFWIVEEVKRQRNLQEGQRPLFQLCANELPLASMIAARASFRRNLVYALQKFLLSNQIFAPDVRSLDPSEGVYHHLSVFPDDHVRFAYAIIAGYSVIEELEMEPRMFPPEHPSTFANGKWDPVIRGDLENRLRAHRIDLSERVIWHLRGPPTRLQKKRPPRTTGKYPWTRGFVRDQAVEVIDAIADASWLRSKVSSHRLSDRASALSVYDVVNVQHLARRLLLEHLGFWRFHQRKASER
jgi:hypothetical protein